MKVKGMKSQILCIGWLLAAVGTGCTAGNVPWSPPEVLVGTWLGKGKVHAPPKKESPGRVYKDWIAIRIHIASDGSVDGQVGDARLVGCKIKSNRGWFGRMLNLWTDYLICNGWLQGPVFNTDPDDAERPFTIPFGLEGERLKGGFMLLLKGKDPFPIFPSLQLTKQRPAQELEATQFDRKGDSPEGTKVDSQGR